MHIKQFITEAAGVGNRQIGSEYYNPDDPDNDRMTLDEIVYFPSEPGHEESVEMLQETIRVYMKAAGIPLDLETDMFSKPNKAAMIVVFNHVDGTRKAFGKYAARNKGGVGINWQNTDFTRQTGYTWQNKTSQTNTLPIKPSNLMTDSPELETDGANDFIKDAMVDADLPDNAIGLREQMPEMIQRAIAGDKTPVEGAGEFASLHEIYTAEYAAPLVIAHKSPLLTGDIDMVERELLADYGLTLDSFTKVKWPEDPAEKLVDSYLIHEKFQLGVSSKAKTAGGAAASVDAIFATMEKNKESILKGMKQEGKAEYFYDAITTIVNNSAKEGPLMVATNMGIIDNEQSGQILEILGNYEFDESELNDKNKELLKDKITVPDLSNDKYNIGYHLITTVAKKVAEELEGQGIDKFFKIVLKHADMVQVYAKVKKDKNGGAYFDSFTLKYPPTTSGKIQVNASKGYMATGIKGKIGFKLK